MCVYILNSVIVGRFPGNRSCDCLFFPLSDTVEWSHSCLNHLILGGPGLGLRLLFLTLWRMAHLSYTIKNSRGIGGVHFCSEMFHRCTIMGA